jgi:hypothetical protein
MKQVVSNELKQPRTRRTLEFVTLILSMVAIGVTVYFSLRSEKKKDLTLRFLVVRQLLDADAGRSNGLAITYQGIQIRQPWLLSARLENTGDLPLERRDIEQPLTLVFQTVRVLGGDVSARSPRDLEASARVDSLSVIVTNGLLNPGDSYSIDILTDGRPQLPAASMRVSGVGRLHVVNPTSQSPVRGPTAIPLPEFLGFLALLVSSIVVLALFAAGIGFLADPVRDFLGKGGKARLLNWIDITQPSSLTFGPEDFSAPLRPIVGAMSGPISAQLLDDPALLLTQLKRIPADLMSAAKMDPQIAAHLIERELRVAFLNTVRKEISRHPPVLLDPRMGSLLGDAKAKKLGAGLTLERVKGRCQQIGIASSGFRAVDFADVSASFVFVFVSVLTGLVVAGGWLAW